MKIITTVRRMNENENFKKKIEKLVSFGVHSFRFNLAKCMDDEKKLDSVFNDILSVKQIDSALEIVLDLPFPVSKFRFSNEKIITEIIKGNKYCLWIGEKPSISHNNYLYIDRHVEAEDFTDCSRVFYDLGQGSFIIESIDKNKILLIAENSFSLYNMKTISFGKNEKNINSEYIDNTISYFVPDALALSFVEDEKDLISALNLKKQKNFQVISKIETAQGIDNRDIIIQKSDAIIFGRGDFLLNSNNMNLLDCEYKLSKSCEKYNKPYYIATDILNSLIHSNTPSRSDIIDLSVVKFLKTSGLILNVDLVESDGIENAIELINNY